jgi:hypothetical protein
MKHKLYKITALMEMGDEPPVIFTFDLPAPDEKGINRTLGKMDSIRKVISVEETQPPTSEVYEDNSPSDPDYDELDAAFRSTI